MITVIVIFEYFCCALFGLIVIAAAVVHFRAVRIRFKNVAKTNDRSPSRPIRYYGVRDAIERGILRRMK